MASSWFRSSKSWWVTTAGDNPRGPLTVAQLAASIRWGNIPESALVCEVGGTAWVALTDVAEIARALADLDAGAEPGDMDPSDDPQEHTIVGRPAFDSIDVPASDGELDGDDVPTIRPMAPPEDWD